jgi:hypothetical protein
MVYHSVTISTQGDKIGCGIHYVFTVGMREGETMMHLDVIILYVIVCRELESATFANEMVVVESSEVFNASLSKLHISLTINSFLCVSIFTFYKNG